MIRHFTNLLRVCLTQEALLFIILFIIIFPQIVELLHILVFNFFLWNCGQLSWQLSVFCMNFMLFIINIIRLCFSKLSLGVVAVVFTQEILMSLTECQKLVILAILIQFAEPPRVNHYIMTALGEGRYEFRLSNTVIFEIEFKLLLILLFIISVIIFACKWNWARLW